MDFGNQRRRASIPALGSAHLRPLPDSIRLNTSPTCKFPSLLRRPTGPPSISQTDIAAELEHPSKLFAESSEAAAPCFATAKKLRRCLHCDSSTEERKESKLIHGSAGVRSARMSGFENVMTPPSCNAEEHFPARGSRLQRIRLYSTSKFRKWRRVPRHSLFR